MDAGSMVQPGALIDLQSLPLELPRSERPLRVLFIADFDRGSNVPDLSVVADYVDAIPRFSAHSVKGLNSRAEYGQRCPDLAGFDAILIHYSILLHLPQYLPEDYRRSLKKFRGLKAVIMQDEFRWIDVVNRHLEELGVHLILSSLSTANLPRVYRAEGVRHIVKCAALPGYIPERFLAAQAPPVARRPLHVTYRGRENPAWFGAMSREKVEIATGFLAAAARFDLRCDISTREEDRLQGADWMTLLCKGRATLTVEGGTSIFDFDGEAERRTMEYLKVQPHAPYEVIAENVLKTFEGNVVHRTITPRSLEAICLRTGLVGFRGEYRGILKADRHYVVLEKDFSNMESVAQRLKDTAYVERLVECAYEEIAAVPDYRFETFVRRLDWLLAEGLGRLAQRPAARGRLHALWRRLAAST
jgi:hypothetical protein